MQEPQTGSSIERYNAVAGARVAVKSVLALVGVIAYLVVMYGTDLGRSVGGTPKQQAFGIAMVCALPLALLYWPLSWLAARSIRRRLAHARGPDA